MGQDLSIYDSRYYERAIPENWFGLTAATLRPDQLAALCYTFGMPFRGNETYPPRNPRDVLSIGCGIGNLEAHIAGMGVRVVATDPSPHVDANSSLVSYTFSRLSCYEAVMAVPEADTVIFCESIEHVPVDEIRDAFDILRLRAVRVIIVNWESFMPIIPDGGGKDHVTLVDEAFYDSLSVGFRVVVRHGSHLVLDAGV